MFDYPVDWIFALRLGLAGLLGCLLGIERDLHGRAAGIRTNMLICMGCCLFGIISSEGYADEDGTPDPTRMASIVIQGIGFLGAGVLLKGDDRIMGLTTAAIIWVSAAIGLTIGAGMEIEAVIMTVFVLLTLVGLGPVSDYFERIGNSRMQAKGRKVVRES